MLKKKIKYCYFIYVALISYALIIGYDFHIQVMRNDADFMRYKGLILYPFLGYIAISIKEFILKKEDLGDEVSAQVYAFSLSEGSLSPKEKSIIFTKYPFVKCLYKLGSLLGYLLVAHVLHGACVLLYQNYFS